MIGTFPRVFSNNSKHFLFLSGSISECDSGRLFTFVELKTKSSASGTESPIQA